jgi:hypothetical protein
MQHEAYETLIHTIVKASNKKTAQKKALLENLRGDLEENACWIDENTISDLDDIYRYKIHSIKHIDNNHLHLLKMYL